MNVSNPGPHHSASAFGENSTFNIDYSSTYIVEVRFASKEEVRVRKVVTRSGTQVRVKCASRKMGRMIHCQSSGEYNAARLLDVYPGIPEFHEQYAEIRYVLNGREYRHYPDFYVTGDTFRGFYEIKQTKDAEDTEVKVRTIIMEKLLPLMGFSYKILLADDLAREPRLSNARLIRRLAITPNAQESEQIRRTFLERQIISWADIHQGILGPTGRSHIFALFPRGVVTFDLEQEMTGSSIVEWTGANNKILRLED